ncbi:hypothetical protein EBU71_03170 [bacterium]|nr:hypothetical protein [Candidatus Elulimicrobium humile]
MINLSKLKKSKFDSYARWVAAISGLTACIILSEATIATQWIGWVVSLLSCSLWFYAASADKDTPRIFMNLLYIFLCIRAIFNWIMHIQ